MQTTTVYVITHKPTKIKSDDSVYTLLQVGAKNKKHFCSCTDDTGNNISEKNATFCELTGMYWIWKNDYSDIVGLCHYRRYFSSDLGWLLKQIFGINTFIYTRKKIIGILSKYDVILANSNRAKKLSVKDQYSKSHHINDLLVTRNVIAEKYPEYIKTFDEVLSGKKINHNNALICRKEIFDKYSEWLFDILFEVEKRIDISTYSDFQKSVQN